MLLIEFEEEIYETICVKYRNIDEDNWYYLYMDVITLHLLIGKMTIVFGY
jgi:hypothetical protein